MKTLIEQFVTQVLSSTENFTLTDGIHNITCTQFKRGQAIFVYGNVSGSYELNLNISAEKVTLRLYAIVREGQIYFYDLNCFGIYGVIGKLLQRRKTKWLTSEEAANGVRKCRSRLAQTLDTGDGIN